MTISIAFFWILLVIVFYAYLGYGLLMAIFNIIKKTKIEREFVQFYPEVVHIIAAYNEEDCIEKKLINTLAIEYPREKYRIIVVADGSTDKTVSITKTFPEIELLFQPERKGKLDAINRAVALASMDSILVFSDANAMLNKESIQLMASHYQDAKVGGVSGEKRVHSATLSNGLAEGLYWKYESIVKQLESDFFTVVGAAGELFSVKRNLFTLCDTTNILDDLSISLNICKMGYIVKYEPLAFATEAPSFSIADEQKRKIRISAGAFQSIFHFKELLNFFKYGKLSFQYISHRLFRWTVCPLALPLLFGLNIFFVLNKQGLLYDWLMICQCIFYGLAFLGVFWVDRKSKFMGILIVPFYFVFMHLSVWKGFFKFLKGRQTPIWEKARRESI